MIITPEELAKITQKRYGSAEAIAAWSAEVDTLISATESAISRKHALLEQERTLQTAQRLASLKS